MPANEIPHHSDISLATVPPTSRQQKLVLVIVVILLVAFAATAPFAATQLPVINAYIPMVQAVILVTDLITAVLLFGHYSVTGSRALLVLANGYLFSALIIAPYSLTFPGAFSPTGLFGGRQSTVWLYIFWHFGFPAAVIGYAFLKDKKLKGQNRPEMAAVSSAPSAIVQSLIIVVALVCALTWAAAHADSFLPHLFLNEVSGSALLPYAAIACSLASAIALGILWRRRSSVLDLWLTVALCAGITEPLLIAVFSSSRFSAGFYAGRVYSIVTSTVVLAALLSEATILYARLSRTNTLLQRERRSKLMNVEAVVASITHEVRQPLSAIAANGSAALLFLDRPTPDLGEAREALNAILQDSFNASQLFDSVRALFKSVDQQHQPVDVNEMALGALNMLRGSLQDHDVTIYTELASELPPVAAHKVQLQEVVLNLVHNAIDAMDAIADRPRVLRVRTEQDGHGAIALSVQDSGPGIDPQKMDVIFDPFVTTKAHGMGLGLAICRMIIERHGGRISASSAVDRGALFQVVLPTGSGALN